MKGTLSNDISNLKNRVINIAIWVGLVFGAITYLISLTRINEFGFKWFYALDVVFLFIIFMVVLFINRISDKVKSSLLIFTLIQAFLVKTYFLGLGTPNILYPIMAAFFGSIYLSLRANLIWLTITVIGYVSLAYAHLNGIITPFIAPEEFTNQLSNWINTLLLIVGTIGVISVYIFIFGKKVEQMMEEINVKNREIEKRQADINALIEGTHHIIGLFDEELNLVDYNQAFEHYALQTDNLKIKRGMNVLDKLNRPQAELFRGFLSRALKGEKFRELIEYPLEGDYVLYFLLSYNPIYENGKVVRVSMFVEDITELQSSKKELEKHSRHLEDLVKERTHELEATNEELSATNEELFLQREELEKALSSLKSAQEKLIESEKMASLGFLSAGVAHEINNPLNFIKGGKEGLKVYFENSEYKSDPHLEKLLDAIDEGVKRASAIVTSLDQFSKDESKSNDNIDLSRLIKSCIILSQSQIKGKADIQTEFCTKKIIITGNKGKLHQAFLNIIINAEQAIESEGKINIKSICNKTTVTVEISDNGVGIDSSVLSRISEPFFTTKDPGKGTGIGLSITRKIIKEHSGDIEFNSVPGKGTKVSVTLPIH